MVLVQKWPFFQLFFLGNIDQENVFYDILERKNAFLGYKNKKLKSRKIDIFPKGLTHGFGPKIASFPTFLFLGNKGQENMFYSYSRTKKRLSRLKKEASLKSLKIDIFPKGLTHGFGPKMAIFPTFFFRQYRPGKCLLRYSRTKKGYKNKQLKKSKN